MEPVFENEITLTPHILCEYMLSQSGKASKRAVMVMIFGYAIFAIGSIMGKNIMLFLAVTILMFIVLLSSKYFPSFVSNKVYKKRLLQNDGKPLKKITRFTESIHVVTASNKELSYEYRQVTKIYETPDLLILKINTLEGILLDKNNFQSGDLKTFRNFIQEKCPSAKYTDFGSKQIKL